MELKKLEHQTKHITDDTGQLQNFVIANKMKNQKLKIQIADREKLRDFQDLNTEPVPEDPTNFAPSEPDPFTQRIEQLKEQIA